MKDMYRRTRTAASIGVVSTLALTMGLVGCAVDDAGAETLADLGDRKVTVVVAALHAAAQYYQEEMDGAKAYGAEDPDVDLEVTAPAVYDPDIYQRQIRDLLSTKPDAMAFTPQPPDLFIRTMKDASAQLEGRVIVFSERPSSTEEDAMAAGVMTAVGYDDRSQARRLLEETIRIAEISESSTGTVLLAGCAPQETGTVALRLAGFTEAVEGLLPHAKIVTLVSDPYVTENQNRWSSALTQHPDAILAAGTCEPDGQSLYRLKKEHGYEFALGAMELTPESLEGLADGTTTAVQSANTWFMGYATARMLTMAARGEPLPEGFISSGGTLFTKENLDDVKTRNSDPATFYRPMIDELFAQGMPAAAPMSDAWK